MPIYAYKCTACGYARDVLQKMSDPQLTVCPQCNAEQFVKQVTAAGFQLKGSGWYATDFKGGAAAAPAREEGGDSVAPLSADAKSGASAEAGKTAGAEKTASPSTASASAAPASPAASSSATSAPKAQ